MFYGSFVPDELRARAASARRAVVLVLILTVVTYVGLWADSDAVEAVALVIGFLGWLTIGIWAFVRWVQWFHAVHDVAYERGRARFGGSWWAWAWLLPVVSAVIPKLMVNDLWRAGDPPQTQHPVPRLLDVWWGFWVVSCAASYLSRGDLAFLDAIGTLGMVFSFALSIPVIRLLTDHAIALSTDQSAGVEPPSTAITEPVT